MEISKVAWQHIGTIIRRPAATAVGQRKTAAHWEVTAYGPTRDVEASDPVFRVANDAVEGHLDGGATAPKG